MIDDLCIYLPSGRNPRPGILLHWHSYLGLPLIVLGIQNGKIVRKERERRNSKDFIEWCGNIPSFNVSVIVGCS